MNIRRMLRRILLFPLALILGTFGDTYETITGSGVLNKTYYQGKFLQGKEFWTVFDQFAKRQKSTKIPLNAGDNVEFTRVSPFGMKRTALTEGTNPNPSPIKGNKVTAELLEYGDFVKPSKKYWLTNMDANLAETAVEQGKSAATTIDSLIWEAVVEGGMGLRADMDSNYYGERTVETSGTSTTAVSFDAVLPTGIASADTGVAVFTDGLNYGIARALTYEGDDSITVSTLDNTPLVGDHVWMVSTEALASGDTVEAEHIRVAVALLEKSGAKPFDDGFFHAVYSPLNKYDFQRDSEWINMKHYAAPKDLYRNLEGEMFGIRFHRDNNPYRSAAATIGTYSASGAVYVISIFGKDAFGNVRVSGIDKKFYMRPPEASNDNALAMYGTMGWYELCCPVVLNGANIVNIFSVPTTL